MSMAAVSMLGSVVKAVGAMRAASAQQAMYEAQAAQTMVQARSNVPVGLLVPLIHLAAVQEIYRSIFSIKVFLIFLSIKTTQISLAKI